MTKMSKKDKFIQLCPVCEKPLTDKPRDLAKISVDQDDMKRLAEIVARASTDYDGAIRPYWLVSIDVELKKIISRYPAGDKMTDDDKLNWIRHLIEYEHNTVDDLQSTKIEQILEIIKKK